MEAVRGRIKRNTIEHERIGDRVYVLVDAAQARPGQDQDAAQAIDQGPLVESLQDQVEYLRDQLRRANERDRENRRIIAALTQRIPAIEAPAEMPGQEPPEATTAATEQPGRMEPQPSVEGAHEGTERRSWWREFFGFGL